MAIPANLQQFKSSGVYRLTFDKSQTASIPAETIRLVVGFSKKGPFNTPVFVPDAEFFADVFGGIDRKLERKGSFFHRTALQCLDRGPIIVLNLLALDDVNDKTEFISFATAPDQTNKTVALAPLSGWFNSDKFWFLDAEDALMNVKTVYPVPHILNFANVGRKNISVLTRKANVNGFDVTAKEWYGTADLPEFLNESDLISDYMIDVMIVEGDYSNYSQLDTDPVFGDFFDTNGLLKNYVDSFGTVKDGVDSFVQLPEVKVLGKYIGSIIPDFTDKSANNLFIEDLVNLESVVTGALCSVDKSAFDDGYVSGNTIDLIGHVVESDDTSTIDFLSYYGTLKSDRVYDENNQVITVANALIGATASSLFPTVGPTSYGTLTASAGLTAGGTGIAGYTGGTHFDTVVLYAPDAAQVNALQIGTPFANDAEFNLFVESMAAGKSYISCSAEGAGGITPTHSRVKTIVATVDSITMQIEIYTQGGTGSYGATSGNFLYLGEAALLDFIPQLDMVDAKADGTTDDLLGFVDSGMYVEYDTDITTTGDKGLMDPASPNVYKPLVFTDSVLLAGSVLSTVITGADVFSHDVSYVKATPYDDAAFTSKYVPGFDASAGATNWTVQTLTGDLNQTISGIENNLLDAPNVVRVSGSVMNTGDVKKDDYLVSTKADITTGKSRLTKVKSVGYDSSADIYTITTFDDIWTSGATGDIEKYEQIDEFVSNYRFKALAGFTMRAAQIPDGSNARQNEILNVMYTTNLKNTLVDREQITFRYIIDTFNGGIEASCKSKLSKIAADRQSALAILNLPSVKNFKDSVDPLFKFNATKKFDARYIAEGGNKSLNPSVTFGLPPVSEGANFAAFYGPNLMIRERGKNISVPPAAWVSNLYIDKYTQALPWSIIAGPRRGVVGGGGIVGLEYQFDRTDLDFIEPFGYNAIVPKKGIGFVINANQTGQQGVKSALSQAHVRELIIYIQDGVEAILKNYRWEFNTAQNRLEIKTLADGFLGQILNDGGLYDFQNIMDTTNNTNDIIDSNMGVLDTYIEPARGMGILVHRTTILKTGAISTGNFI